MNDTDVIFEWRVHPIADFPRRRFVFLAAVSVTLLLVWFSFQDLFWVVFSLVFLLAALNSFVLPTNYRLSETELEIVRIFPVKSRKLNEVRRVDCDPNGFFLSPFRRKSRLDNFRGVFIPYPKERKEDLKEFLLKYCRQEEHLNRESGGDSST